MFDSEKAPEAPAQEESRSSPESPERLRIIRIAEWLEAGGDGQDDKGRPVRFRMESWRDVRPYCGTVCCIGGAVYAFYPKEVKALRLAIEGGDDIGEGTISERLLGLTEQQANALFFGRNNTDNNFGPGLFGCTAAHAAKVLRHYLATGEIDWRASV